MKTVDTILEALKEGEIEMLDSVWKKGKEQSITVQVARRGWNLRGHGPGGQGSWPRTFKVQRPYTLLKLGNGGSSQTK